MDIKPDHLINNPFVPAAVGALVGLKAMPGTSLWEKVTNLALGFGFAVFVGPATADWLDVTSPRVHAGIVFACGAAGLVAFSAVMEGIKSTQFGQIITGWLSRRHDG